MSRFPIGPWHGILPSDFCLQYGYNRIKAKGELFPVHKALIPGFVACLYSAQKASELYIGTLQTYVSVSSGPDICPVRGCSATSATELEVARGRIRWSSPGGRPLAPARRSNACQPKPSNRFEKPLQLLLRPNRMNAMSCSHVCAAWVQVSSLLLMAAGVVRPRTGSPRADCSYRGP